MVEVAVGIDDPLQLQILVAQGEPLPVGQGDLAIDGHAVEVRLYAEDPESFLPATGRIALWEPPELPGLRIDSGVVVGSEITMHYDPMLGKLIAHGPTRGEALDRLVYRAIGDSDLGFRAVEFLTLGLIGVGAWLYLRPFGRAVALAAPMLFVIHHLLQGPFAAFQRDLICTVPLAFAIVLAFRTPQAVSPNS